MATINIAILDEVLGELERAESIFPSWPTDPIHAVAIIGEEFCELIQEALQCTYQGREMVRREAVQVAAMSLRFLKNFENMEIRPSPQK